MSVSSPDLRRLSVESLLTLKNIKKTFPGVKALKGVSFSVNKGEIIGIVGENGAGKSTLIKTIGGAIDIDEGEIILNGVEQKFSSPNDALNKGISVVHQELSLCENLSVRENLFVKDLKNKNRRMTLHKIDFEKQTREAAKLLELFELNLDPAAVVGDLSLAEREQIEILRAIAYNPKLMILDEPTGPLSIPVVQKLFKLLGQLKNEGISILYISHEISEIVELCDQVVILRDGEFIDKLQKEEMREDKIAGLMVGRELGTMFPEKKIQIKDEAVLELENFSNRECFSNINFKLRKGEILGISGLIGAGRTELALAIFGALPHSAGRILLNGKEVKIKNPKKAMELGIGYLTEDRKKLGLFLSFSIEENMLSIDVNRYSRNRIVKNDLLKRKVDEFVKLFDIKASNGRILVGTLSGGNQQKILLAKTVSIEPDILIVDEPTRGIDIGAKKAIHQHLQNIADQGKSIILISSEMTEVLGMSDRILVMDNGKTVQLIDNDDSVTQESIMASIVDFKSREKRNGLNK